MRIFIAASILAIFINGAFAQVPPVPNAAVNPGHDAALTKPVPAAVSSTDEAAADNEDKSLWSHGSLMFDKKTSEWINIAIRSHEKQIPLEILLPSLFPPDGKTPVIDKPQEQTIVQEVIQKVEGPKEAPAFYLKTILYFSRNNWSLWLNSQKITDKTIHLPDDKSHDISAIKVTKDEAIFLWRNTRINEIYPNWKNEFISIDGEKYSSPEKNIVIDNATGNLSFVLKPNQSFVSNPLTIVEGRAASSDLTKNAPQPVTQGATGGITGSGMPAITQGVQMPGGQIPENTPVIAPLPDVNKSAKKMDNKVETLKNLEILKSILDQNSEKLGN